MNKISKKIMVVEDETIVARDILSTLSELGYDTSEVYTTGEDAINNVGDICPDLILMDIKLKGELDGIETGEAIYRKYRIPIIYLTGHADDELFSRTINSRPYGYIVKPFDPVALQTTIEIGLYKHEFENLLVGDTENAIATIIGCVELLLEDKKSYNKATISKLEMIRSSANEIKDTLDKF